MHPPSTHTVFDAALDAIAARMGPTPATGSAPTVPAATLAHLFTPFPIVIGARWMETPIRQGLAQRHGIAANLLFLLVDEAVDRLVAPPVAGQHGWWDEPAASTDWTVAALRTRVVQALRAPQHDDVRQLAAGLQIDATGALNWRALAFADQLATALLEWMRARPEADLQTPSSTAPWFRPLVSTLGLDAPTSPRTLRLQALAAPRQPARGPWGGPVVVGTTLLPTVTRTLLERSAATFLSVLPEAAAPDASLLRIRPCYGPLREVEALRDWLLEMLAVADTPRSIPAVTPRDVVVLTPSPEVYGPLIAAVFGRQGRAVSRPRPTSGASPVDGPGADAEAALAADPEPSNGVPADDDVSVRAQLGDDDDALELVDDVETVAEAHAATGGSPRPAPPAIPVRVVELGLARANPLADTLLRVLTLAEDRVELPAVLALLALRPVQRCFGLSPEDVPALSAMLVDSGARWGLHAADRAVAGQPALEQNSFRFGLERMALGRLMPADTLDCGPDREPRVTMDLGSRDQLARIGRLDRVLRALEHAIGDLRATRPAGLVPSAWRSMLNLLLQRFTTTSAAMAWQRQHLDEVLDGLLPATADAIGPVSAPALRRLLTDGFAVAQGAPVPNEGAVTVAPLRPHGVPPAQVVALLGMGLGAFPRAPVLPSWHPLSAPHPDEPGPRERAAAAFDAACATATHRLWISWSGFEMQRGRPLPPCASVARLIDAAGLSHLLEAAMNEAPAPGARVDRDARIARVHRHPWDAATEQVHDPDHADVHARRQAEQAARAHAQRVTSTDTDAGADNTPTPVDPYRQPLPDPDCPTALTVDELVRALRNPSEVFLRDRLGIYLPEDDVPPPAREPLEVNTLDRHDIRTRLLVARGGGADDAPPPGSDTSNQAAGEVLTRLRGEGKLPVAAGAQSFVDEQDQLVRALLMKWRAQRPPGQPQAVDLSATIHGVTLSTQVNRRTLTDNGWVIELLGVSGPERPRSRLRIWISTLLAAVVADETPVRGLYLGIKSKQPDTFEVEAVSRADATKALSELIDVWRTARTRPIELFEETSAKLAQADAEHPEGGVAREAELQSAARRFHAEAEEFSAPDGTNRHVRVLRPTYDAVDAVTAPQSELRDLSQAVWGGLAAQEHAKTAATKLAADAKPAKASKSAGKKGAAQ